MKYGKWIALGFVVLVMAMAFSLFSWAIGTYNSFVAQREGVVTSWSQVETQYQRRFDLIPNLANSVKGYLKQEQTVFGEIADARTYYAGAPSGSDAKVTAANQLEGAFARLLVIMENYPELKSNETVRDLMTELAGTENRVNVSRQRYNEVVQVYNVHVQTFPANLIAGFGGFEKKPFFESQKGSENAPTVNLQ